MPFEKYLAEEVVIVPDAVLNYLPFGVLLTQPPTLDVMYSELPYLEKEYVISYNYSATLGRQMEEGQTSFGDRFLVVAPEFNEDSTASYGTLLFNSEEAREISEITKGEILAGPQASKSEFLKSVPDYGSFHFATHAVVNEDDADLSFLVFQKKQNEKNQLYLQELYSIKIPANIVTLSACQTNVVPLLQGEGIASLAKGFSYAGAKSIVTSMWDVDDLSTKTLMTGFYRELAIHKNKDVALREAKLNYLKQAEGILGHPFFWATFIAIGDMSALNIHTDPSISYGVVLLILIIFVPLLIYASKKWIY